MGPPGQQRVQPEGDAMSERPMYLPAFFSGGTTNLRPRPIAMLSTFPLVVTASGTVLPIHDDGTISTAGDRPCVSIVTRLLPQATIEDAIVAAEAWIAECDR